MLRWLIAANEPRIIEATAMNQMIWRHSTKRPPNGPTITRTKSTSAAVLGATEKKAVTGVGAPS